MSENKNKDKVSFRVRWTSNADTSEGKLFAYLNSLSYHKRPKIVNLLKASFYPEVVYKDRSLNQENLREIDFLIMQLEQRALYLRRLLNIAPDVDLSSRLPTISNNVSPNIEAETSSLDASTIARR